MQCFVPKRHIIGFTASWRRAEGAVPHPGGDGGERVPQQPDERARPAQAARRAQRHHDGLPRVGGAPGLLLPL